MRPARPSAGHTGCSGWEMPVPARMLTASMLAARMLSMTNGCRHASLSGLQARGAQLTSVRCGSQSAPLSQYWWCQVPWAGQARLLPALGWGTMQLSTRKRLKPERVCAAQPGLSRLGQACMQTRHVHVVPRSCCLTGKRWRPASMQHNKVCCKVDHGLRGTASALGPSPCGRAAGTG